MKLNRLQLAALAVIAALVIAVFLRDAVQQLIIEPAAYFLWFLSLTYRFIPQPVIWVGLILAMLYLAIGNVAGKFEWPRLKKPPRQSGLGPVGEFAAQIERREGGIYFKWQVARTLGDLALDLQFLHNPDRRRKLEGLASISPVVARYLEVGINTSFSDYPMQGGYLLSQQLPDWLPFPEGLRQLPTTPFDIDLEPVIGYLESQMENEDDLRRA